MKLAEALMQRADCQKRAAQLKTRLLRSVKVQEGERPPEEPADLFRELDQVMTELEKLVMAINRTNNETVLEGATTMADALGQRDILAQRRSAVQDVIEAAAIRQERYSKSEVRFVATVDIAALQKQADKLAQAYRELDTRIQEFNWRTELIR